MKSTFYFSLLFVVMAWCEPLLPTRLFGKGVTVAAADVVSYTLVNADTDTDLLTMTPGIVLNLAALPTRNLNIRANTNPAVTGSVVFTLSGTQTRIATENVVPYALFSDYMGNYFPWTPALGNYTLVALPYDGPSGTGTAGISLTISFTVVNIGMTISSYTLVNADTNRDLLTITPGMTLNLAALPRNLNIRANTNAITASVELNLTGTQTHFESQNVIPYSLFGDFQGNYFNWTPTPIAGVYTLTATPFTAANGGGQAGTALTISFTLTGTAPLPVQLTTFTAEEQGAAAVQLRWNTATELNNKEFEVQRSSDGKLFNVLSRVTGHGSTTTAHDYSYTDRQLPSNTTMLYYRLRQVDTDGTATFSPVRTVTVQLQAKALQVFAPVVPDGLLYYTYSGPITGTEQLELYTLVGQRRGQFPLAATGSGTVPIAGLPPGGYVLRLMSEKSHYTSRFMLP